MGVSSSVWVFSLKPVSNLNNDNKFLISIVKIKIYKIFKYELIILLIYVFPCPELSCVCLSRSHFSGILYIAIQEEV